MSINRHLRQPLCLCGSQKFRRPLYDARSIFCCYVCDSCEKSKREQYREDIFTDKNYWASEPIDWED